MSIIICIGRYLLLCENKGVRSVCVENFDRLESTHIYLYIYMVVCVYVNVCMVVVLMAELWRIVI